ncbi:DUF4411 family protein [Corynebacterium accolens]|uniref:DUF4411 family protein n=1 Tax=Corynebacterium accolens TaxID=38284 RepID=UPI003D711F4A
MYLVDSNIVIDGFRTYPPDSFPSYWRAIESFVKRGKFLFHEKVCEEILIHEDDKSSWLKKTVPRDRWIRRDDELESYRAVTKWARVDRQPAYNPQEVRQFLNNADSWLVASAHAKRFTILTNETPATSKEKRVKIPDAAEAFSIPCISNLQFLRRHNLRF